MRPRIWRFLSSYLKQKLRQILLQCRNHVCYLGIHFRRVNHYDSMIRRPSEPARMFLKTHPSSHVHILIPLFAGLVRYIVSTAYSTAHIELYRTIKSIYSSKPPYERTGRADSSDGAFPTYRCSSPRSYRRENAALLGRGRFVVNLGTQMYHCLSVEDVENNPTPDR